MKNKTRNKTLTLNRLVQVSKPWLATLNSGNLLYPCLALGIQKKTRPWIIEMAATTALLKVVMLTGIISSWLISLHGRCSHRTKRRKKSWFYKTIKDLAAAATHHQDGRLIKRPKWTSNSWPKNDRSSKSANKRTVVFTAKTSIKCQLWCSCKTATLYLAVKKLIRPGTRCRGIMHRRAAVPFFNNRTRYSHLWDTLSLRISWGWIRQAASWIPMPESREALSSSPLPLLQPM